VVPHLQMTVWPNILPPTHTRTHTHTRTRTHTHTHTHKQGLRKPFIRQLNKIPYWSYTDNMRNYSQLSTDFPLITFRLLELRYLVINFTSLPHRQSHACPKHVRLFRNIQRTIFSHGEHSDHRFMCALLNYVPLGRNDLPFFSICWS